MRAKNAGASAPGAQSGTRPAAGRTRPIAIVSHSHPDLTKGGAEVSAYALYRGLREIGREAIFVASCLESDQARVEPRPGEYLIPREPHGYDHFYQLSPDDTPRRLAALLQAHDVGVVNFHHFLFLGLNTVRALQGLGMRLVLTLHEYLAICHHHGQMVTRPQQNLCRASGRIACQTCFPEITGEEFDLRRHNFLEVFEGIDAFVSPSHFLKDRFTAWGLAPERIAVIENGLLGHGTGRGTGTGPRMAAGGGPRPAPVPEGPAGDEAPAGATRPLTIGYFGQITPFKGVGVLLDAIEQMEREAAAARLAATPGSAATMPGAPAIRFRIHGNLVGLDPAFVARFEALAKDSPMLQFVGPYANAEVLSLMRDCDYVIVPSQWWENSPVVIQEAYAAGCPLIASDLGGLAEKVIEGVSGLHFRMGDPDSLCRVLERAAAPGMVARLKEGLPRVSTARDMAMAYAGVLAGEESENAGRATAG